MPRSLTHPEQIDRIQRADGEAKGHPVSLTPGNDVQLGMSPPRTSAVRRRTDNESLCFARGYIGSMVTGIEAGRYDMRQVAISLRYLLGELS